MNAWQGEDEGKIWNLTQAWKFGKNCLNSVIIRKDKIWHKLLFYVQNI